MRRARLSEREKEIIGECELDALKPIQKLAKTLKIKSYTAQSILKRLKDRGVIKVKPFIDVARFGKLDIAVFFSLALTRQNVLTSFLKQVNELANVAYFQSLAGDYQFLAALHCTHLAEAQGFLKKISLWSNGSVISKTIVPRTKYFHYRKKYLTRVNKQEGALTALDTYQQQTVTEHEQVLLKQLAGGEFDSIRQVARDLKLPYSTVDYRYQQLIDKKIIGGWFYDIEDEFLEVQKFKLLINCKDISSEFEHKLERFARFHPNIVYMLQTFGEWDFEFGLECLHTEDVMKIIAQLYEYFPKDIASIKSLTELKTFKFNMFPGLLQK